MSLGRIFDIASSGLAAETTRMTTSASNMNNANVTASNPDDTYRAQYPVFSTVQEQAGGLLNPGIRPGVKVSGIYESETPPVMRYEPNNPLADKDGFVYAPNISYVEEMANLISASRAYQMNLEMINTTKQLMQRTLQLGE
ncbi:flagellar basal body rod protein FlgC [Legionella birminghamensis]|uniref:Flagellar basal-body rod protein FlgC n=1 Tax=Legionella birminghamensis TaxID=28083 RepID=A0A378I9G3_9GAMM|nr:flagellar basal body rod protein FlgC [Legionella birminghamensis]KTC74679.1 flagellar basal body rod protein FlgC [Legionella birminghamensis]STX31482.1 flagellar basal-body rod protein FlgC [Legionella birminghamensis]